jgi:hypothetical protein|tara:strand:+ start:11891 stop:12016 length:126 start_codon:yes stop_codon:yes gene_type:complete
MSQLKFQLNLSRSRALIVYASKVAWEKAITLSYLVEKMLIL